MTNEEDEKAWKYEDEKNLQTSNSFKGISKDPNAPINLQTNCDKPSLADRRQDAGVSVSGIEFGIYREEDVKQAIKETIKELEELYYGNQLMFTIVDVLEIIKSKFGKELCKSITP